MNTRVIFLAIAPRRPACFASHDTWISYLEGAAADHRSGHGRRPLLTTSPPSFNFALRFCEGCTQQHSLAMERAGKCDPHYLKKIAHTERAAA